MVYLEKLKLIPAEKRVYIDESGIAENLVKDKAWSKKGKRVFGKKSGNHYKRTNLVAGYLNNGCIGPYTFTSQCNSEVFNRWLAERLVPELSPGQVVIMDKGKFHKDKKTRELIERAKCELLYLPAYSPDLNPIEKYWAKLKRWLKENREKFSHMLDALNYFLVAT
jgi:transposase